MKFSTKCCDASKILISAESLNDLVYIHLCDLTWAKPRFFCWQDDRRSRSDQVAKDKLIQFNVYFSVNFADESSQLSIISFMDCLYRNHQGSVFSPKYHTSQWQMNFISQKWMTNKRGSIISVKYQGQQWYKGPKSCNNNFCHIYDSNSCGNLTK